MNRRELLKGFGASLLAGGPILACVSLKRPERPQTTTEPPLAWWWRETAPERSDMDRLLDAIMWVESKGDPRAIGDCGNAVGAYQIWKIYVDDVNRIVSLHHAVPDRHMFTYSDRFNPILSRSMTRIFIIHYGRDDLERMARVHNGGPRGHLLASTLPYWKKVKAEMERSGR